MKRSSAERLAEALPWTRSNILRIAAAYLADPVHGALPQDFAYLVLTQGELEAGDVEPLLDELARLTARL